MAAVVSTVPGISTQDKGKSGHFRGSEQTGDPLMPDAAARRAQMPG